MADLLTRKSGVKISADRPPNGGDSFQIILDCCKRDGKFTGWPPGTERLSKLPNADQAYRIVPVDERTLALTAAQPQGVYYAVQTLKQLIAAAPSAEQGRIVIPLADVTDWPDMAERGMWGGDVNDDMPWLTQWKMNLVETHVERVAWAGRSRRHQNSRRNVLNQAREHAVNLVPVITHLDQLPPALFVRYPQLKAVASEDDKKACRNIGDDIQPVCWSQPKAEEILADWLACLAQYPQVSDVMVWLGEEKVSCHCQRCAAVDPFVLQTQVARAALADGQASQTDVAAPHSADPRQLREQCQGIGRRAARSRGHLLRRQPHLRFIARADDLSAPGEVCGGGRRVGMRPAVDRFVSGRLPVDGPAVHQGPDDRVC